MGAFKIITVSLFWCCCGELNTQVTAAGGEMSWGEKTLMGKNWGKGFFWFAGDPLLQRGLLGLLTGWCLCGDNLPLPTMSLVPVLAVFWLLME